jgi:hypothetical protein
MMPLLRGPTDPDHFRVAIGRYGDRWYHDPLPADANFPAIAEAWPSVSTCKKASGSDWSFVALKRVNLALQERPDRFAGMDAPERYEALKAINKLGLSSSASRGTNVHTMAEARLYGRTPLIGNDSPGVEYRGAVDSFFDTYQPELVAAEFVCIHRDLNGFGYGGTCDAALRIDGKTYIVDWKSRGEDSEHGASPEEAAQVAAYARAQYVIADGNVGAERQAVPVFDGGLIVSIKPDGFRVYPVDLDAAFTHWTALHAWWVARRDERAAIGRTWAAKKIAAPAPPATVAPSPGPVLPSVPPAPQGPAQHIPSFDETPPPVVVPASSSVVELPPFDDAPPPAPESSPLPVATLSPQQQQETVRARPAPDEGADGAGSTFDFLERKYFELGAEGRAWITTLTTQAIQAGCSFHAKDNRTVRRFEILSSLVILCEAGAIDDEVLRALLEHVIGAVAHFAAVPTGQLLGSLDVHEALRLKEACMAFTGGAYVASISPLGHFSLQPAA